MALGCPQHEKALVGLGFDDVTTFAAFRESDVNVMQEMLKTAGVPVGHEIKIIRAVRAPALPGTLCSNKPEICSHYQPWANEWLMKRFYIRGAHGQRGTARVGKRSKVGSVSEWLEHLAVRYIHASDAVVV